MAYGPLHSPYNPHYEPQRRFGTTRTELFHIAIAMVALAASLFLVFTFSPGFRAVGEGLSPVLLGLVALLISFLGFVLHELGHKFTAQHFGHWSEFRANWGLLSFGVALAAIPPHFIFAAPGATWHTGYSKTDQGKISAMGPLVNLAIAVLVLPLMLPRTLDEAIVNGIARVVVNFSAFLALFNLIPFGALDGRKVISWNPVVWTIMLVTAIGIWIYSNTPL